MIRQRDGIDRRDPPPRSPTTTTLCCPDTTCLYYMYHWRRTPLSLPRMPCHVRTPTQEWALSPHLSHSRLTTVIRGLIRGFINPRTSPGSLFLSHTSSDCWVGGDLVFSPAGYLWKWLRGEGSVNKLKSPPWRTTLFHAHLRLVLLTSHSNKFLHLLVYP